MVVLDTEPMSLLEWSGAQGSAKLQARLATLQPVEVVTTIVSYEEQVRGWMAYIARLRSVTQQVDAYRRLHRQLDNKGYLDLSLPGL
jgi:tRNA(fMet)-specific endonuclease VapC